MSNKKIYSKSYRVRKAYWTAFVVMKSYIWLSLKSKIFGNNYYNKRITPLHLKNANRIKKVILELEGLFIKVGQLLSILSNFLPKAFQEPLEALQNQIQSHMHSTPQGPGQRSKIRVQGAWYSKSFELAGIVPSQSMKYRLLLQKKHLTHGNHLSSNARKRQEHAIKKNNP